VEPLPSWQTNAGRVADRAAVLLALESGLRTRTAREWVEVLAQKGIPCAPVQDLSQLPTDPQVVATGQLHSLPHPAGPVTVVGSPLRLDGRRPRPHDAPPLLGQHTDEVLTALGLSPEQVLEVTGAQRR
jgi:crotonobetainyl-CoA:carnitine CoA-transferase CaiB-like acyl-CoA transferase